MSFERKDPFTADYHDVLEKHSDDRDTEYVDRQEDVKEEMPAAPEVEAPVYGFADGISFWAFSQRGESHIKNGLPCQDRCAVKMIENTNFLVAAIADGVGSCALSDLGAYIAVHAAINYLESALLSDQEDEFSIPKAEDEIIGDLLRGVMKFAYDEVEKAAVEMEQLLYSLQSTLTVALYDGSTLYFAHAGDDGIVVLREDGMLKLASARHKGEEASSVFPLQSQNTWQFGKVEHTAAFIMATDGVLDAFVRNAAEKNRIYYPFIEPILTQFPKTVEEVKENCLDYYEYMAGKDYRYTVTDDLTLAAVTNQNRLCERILPSFSMEEWNYKTAQYQAKVFAALYPDAQEQHRFAQHRQQQEERQKSRNRKMQNSFDDDFENVQKKEKKKDYQDYSDWEEKNDDLFLIILCFVFAVAVIILILFFFF